MAVFLRPCPAGLALALSGDAELWSADLFQFNLSDGVTSFFWAAWPKDLSVAGIDYLSRTPWLTRGQWSIDNTMSVPTLDVTLIALNDGFNSGANIKTQIHNGLFDGASFLLSRCYMATPDDGDALGAIELFGGAVAGIDIDGSKAAIKIKGGANKLDQMVPRNLYQIPCRHGFCDSGCTLARATYTTAYVVGAAPAPSSTFIPWAAAPGTPARYLNGNLAVTSGPASGARRTIVGADATGLTLAYPLYSTPVAGDGFSAFEGCDKTFNSGSVQSCTSRSNTQNHRGYEFLPPPNAAV